MHSGGNPESAARYAGETERIERIAVDAVVAVERGLGHQPTEMPHNNPGYDIESMAGEHLDFIEVKGRIAGADSVHITRTELLTALNKQQRSVLALVRVAEDDSTNVRYLRNPFGPADQPAFGVACVIYEWQSLWDRGEAQ